MAGEGGRERKRGLVRGGVGSGEDASRWVPPVAVKKGGREQEPDHPAGTLRRRVGRCPVLPACGRDETKSSRSKPDLAPPFKICFLRLLILSVPSYGLSRSPPAPRLSLPRGCGCPHALLSVSPPRQSGSQCGHLNAARLSSRRERCAFLLCYRRGPSSPTSLPPRWGEGFHLGAHLPFWAHPAFGGAGPVGWDGHCGGGCLGTQQEEPLPDLEVSVASP